MKEVIRTGVLSKRWHLLWTSAHTLIFKYSGFENQDIKKFATFVDDTLLLCQSGKVKKFSVDFAYDKSFARYVNKWMIFIKIKHVEELDLYLREEGWNGSYGLPHHVYSNVWLQELSLCNCNILPKGEINWPALRVLSIKYAKLDDNVVQKISSGCPALESLKFTACSGVNCFRIDSKSVKKLVFNGYWPRNLDEEEELEIHATNITSLEIRGEFDKKIVVLKGVQALVDAKLDFFRTTNDYRQEDDSRTDKTMLRDLLVSLKHVEKLSIGSWCLQGLMRCLLCPVMRCKYLTLNSHLMEIGELPGISILLQSCPLVEILNINLDSPFEQFYHPLSRVNSYDFNKEDYWKSRAGWLRRLKTLRITGFWRCVTVSLNDYIGSFLRVVLKDATMLEKIIIDPAKDEAQCPSSDYRRAAEKLLSFPRSSRDAVILFSG